MFRALSATESSAPGFGTNKVRFLDLQAKRQITKALVKILERDTSIIVQDERITEYLSVLHEMSSSTDNSLANSASLALNHLSVGKTKA